MVPGLQGAELLSPWGRLARHSTLHTTRSIPPTIVSDPGFLSRIPDTTTTKISFLTFFSHKLNIICFFEQVQNLSHLTKNLSIFLTQNFFTKLSAELYRMEVRDMGSEIRIRMHGSKTHRIQLTTSLWHKIAYRYRNDLLKLRTFSGILRS